MKRLFVSDRGKVWMGLAVVFAAGALIGNAAWVHYYNQIDQRHINHINETIVFYEDKLSETIATYEDKVKRNEDSYKRSLGEMRNRVEKKVDNILDKLDKIPQSPIIISAKREIESVKNEH